MSHFYTWGHNFWDLPALNIVICVYVKNMLHVYQSLLMVVLHFEAFHIHSTYSFTPSKLFILWNVFIAL